MKNSLPSHSLVIRVGIRLDPCLFKVRRTITFIHEIMKAELIPSLVSSDLCGLYEQYSATDSLGGNIINLNFPQF